MIFAPLNCILLDVMANINQLKYVSVFLEPQWALPVQGQHCICFEAVLQPQEWEPSLHVSINFHINHYVFLWLTFVATFVWELFSVYTCRSENVRTYKETPRISFYMVVTNPATPSIYIPKGDVEAAIRWGFIHDQENESSTNMTAILVQTFMCSLRWIDITFFIPQAFI